MRNWANPIHESAWEYNTTLNTTIDFTPYELLYAKKIMFPIEFKLKTLRT